MKKLFIFGLVSWTLVFNFSLAQGVSSDNATFIDKAPTSSSLETSANNFSYTIHSNSYSDYVMLEIYGVKNMLTFEIKDQSGHTVYDGGILNSQLIETKTWNPGIYYLYIGNKAERFIVSK